MTLQQAIDVLEYRHKWFNIKTINATLGDVHALFSFQEKWQSEYGTNPFDDRVMMDAIAVIIDHHRSPSRPQESDTEPTPETDLATVDPTCPNEDGLGHFQRVSDHDQWPQTGSLICPTEWFLQQTNRFQSGKAYEVKSSNSNAFSVDDDRGMISAFDKKSANKFFSPQPTPEPFTPKEGEVLIAIDPCVLQGGFRHGMNALTVNAEYKVISCNGNSFVITDDIGNGHTFTFDHAHKYFKRKP